MPTKRPKLTGSTVLLDEEVADYLLARSARERAEGRESTYKVRFMKLLEESGQLQEGGHRLLLLNEPVLFQEYKRGKARDRDIVGIRRMRRTTQTLNIDKAMALVERLGLTKQCTKTEVVLDEDSLLAASFTGQISDEDMQSIYDEKESFAFYLVDSTQDPDDTNTPKE